MAVAVGAPSRTVSTTRAKRAVLNLVKRPGFPDLATATGIARGRVSTRRSENRKGGKAGNGARRRTRRRFKMRVGVWPRGARVGLGAVEPRRFGVVAAAQRAASAPSRQRSGAARTRGATAPAGRRGEAPQRKSVARERRGAPGDGTAEVTDCDHFEAGYRTRARTEPGGGGGIIGRRESASSISF